MIPYSRKVIDLTVPQASFQVAGIGASVTGWTVLELPGGTGATLRLGQNGDPIPLEDGMSWEYDPCVGPETEGLFFDLPVAAAGQCVIVVMFGGGTVRVGI